MIDSNKKYSELNQLKATINEKVLELMNRKAGIFHCDYVRTHVSLVTKKLQNLDSEVFIHCRIQQFFNLLITVYFEQDKIIFTIKSIALKTTNALLT